MKRFRAPPILILVLGLLVVLAWILLRPTKESEPAHIGGAGSPALASPPSNASLTPSAATAPLPAPARQVVEVAPPVADSPSPTLEPGQILVRGALVLVDSQGVERTEEDGEFAPNIWSGNRGKQGSTVPIVDGRFEVAMDPACRLRIRNLTIAGADALPERDEKHAVDAQTILEVRAYHLRDTLLRVVDAATGYDLPALTVVQRPRRMPDYLTHPGRYEEDDVLFSDAASPITLAPRVQRGVPTGLEIDRLDQSVLLWVRSPGYAWGRIKVLLGKGGERELGLTAAAELEVALENLRLPSPPPAAPRDPSPPRTHPAPRRGRDAPPLRPVFRLRDAPELGEEISEHDGRDLIDGAPRFERDIVDASPILVSDLAPGAYLVSVEIGRWWEESNVLLGWTSAELVAGRRTQVTLPLDDPPEPGTPVPLAGTVFLPPAWGDRTATLLLEAMDLPVVDYNDKIRIPFDAMEPVAVRAGLYRWSAGLVPPSRYVARLVEFELQTVFHVEEGGLSDAHIEVNAPAEVSLRFTDAETGEAAPVAAIRWNCARPPGVSGGGITSEIPGPVPGTFRFRAPAGMLEVATQDKAYAYHSRTYELEPGANEITVEVNRACGIVISACTGEQPLPLNTIRHQFTILEVDGPGRVTTRSWSSAVESTRCSLSGPGIYEVRVHPLEDYAPVPPEFVTVPAGEFVEHIVELTPQR